MPARDDFGSTSGTSRGYSGGAGGLGNGGVGGGMGGGLGGGGAARNGGIGSRTGLTTGNKMYGGIAKGRPGGPAMNPGAWGVRPQPAVTQGPLSGMPRQRTPVPGLLSPPATVPPNRAVEDAVITPATAPELAVDPAWTTDVDYDWAVNAPNPGDYYNPYTSNLQSPVPYDSARSPLPGTIRAPGGGLSYTYNNRLPEGYSPGNYWGGASKGGFR